MLTAEDALDILVPRLIAAGADLDRVNILKSIHRDNKDRMFLLGEEVGLSVITHPAKNAGARAMDHFMGSQAFIAVARVGHLCVEEVDSDEHGQRVPTGRTLFCNPKITAAGMKMALAYRIAGASGGPDHRTGADIKTSTIIREETVEITAD